MTVLAHGRIRNIINENSVLNFADGGTAQ